jgi:hypothetical protein
LTDTDVGEAAIVKFGAACRHGQDTEVVCVVPPPCR